MKYYLAIFTIFLLFSIVIDINCDDNKKSSTANVTPTQINLEKTKTKKVTSKNKSEVTNKKFKKNI